MKHMTLAQYRAAITPDNSNLNLFWNSRRLLILAITKCNFDLYESMKLNMTTSNIHTYKILVYRHNILMKPLRDLHALHIASR